MAHPEQANKNIQIKIDAMGVQLFALMPKHTVECAICDLQSRFIQSR